MMKTSVVASILSIVFISGAILGKAQCNEWKWPEDKAKAEESLVLLKDNKTNGHFKQAVPPLNWLLTNVPNLHTNVYIYGAEVYEGLAKGEKDPAKKQKYIDSLLTIYDLRIKNCGEEGPVTNRKAINAFQFMINAKGKEEEVLNVMDQAIEMNGTSILDGTLVPYMQTVQINKIRVKKLTDEDVLNRYDKVMNIIDGKIKKAESEGKPVDKYKEYKAKVDEILVSEGVLTNFSCDLVKKNLEPKFRENKSDPELAKKMLLLMIKGKCTDDPLWLEVAEVYIKDNADFVIIKNVAVRYMAKDNFSRAEELLNKALPLAPSPQDKAEVLMYLAGSEAKSGNKSKARDLLLQAVAADPSRKDAYEKIGDLYYSSFNDCAKKEFIAIDRYVYLVAYDMYQRAGDDRKKAMAKEAFPSKEEIFELNLKAGSSVKIDCWINESTILRTRN